MEGCWPQRHRRSAESVVALDLWCLNVLHTHSSSRVCQGQSDNLETPFYTTYQVNLYTWTWMKQQNEHLLWLKLHSLLFGGKHVETICSWRGIELTFPPWGFRLWPPAAAGLRPFIQNLEQTCTKQLVSSHAVISTSAVVVQGYITQQVALWSKPCDPNLLKLFPVTEVLVLGIHKSQYVGVGAVWWPSALPGCFDSCPWRATF